MQFFSKKRTKEIIQMRNVTTLPPIALDRGHKAKRENTTPISVEIKEMVLHDPKI